MKQRQVVFAPEAAGDLRALYDWVADEASPVVALAYLERVEAFCQRLGMGSDRGHLRTDIRPDLRIIGFERRLTIAFRVDEDRVTVLRVVARGRNWEASI
ncbi:type II toxin-antitoxin system RelE/ParE family toxin [Pseudogemmobacter bohemicus]|uniref:type II toxin-antitoxin system RelE/ParE family toxin n=1 Tax=Pseudogemmobacter bohemicus TaxID=2250708 RepID=UPI000DD32964|nr:type II toxin-antitoxin system RelE/ParE family toxin [Pseudogemmobacter bohemicus]